LPTKKMRRWRDKGLFGTKFREMAGGWGLGILALFATGLILVFSSMFVLQEPIPSIEMAQNAWQSAIQIKQEGLVQGLSSFRGEEGIRALVLALPLTLTYLIFGYSPMATIGYSLFCSLINLGLVYQIARHYFGEATAVISGLIWAVLPWPILMGGAVAPLAPQLLLSLLVVYGWLSAERVLSGRALISLGAWLLLFLLDPAQGLVLVLFGILVLGVRGAAWTKIRRRVWGKAVKNNIVLIVGGLSFILIVMIFPLTNLFANIESLFAEPGLFLLTLGFWVSITVHMKEKTEGSGPIMNWMLSGFVGITFLLLRGIDIRDLFWETLFLYTLAPFVILFGAYLAQGISQDGFSKTIPGLMGISLLFFGIVGLGQHELVPNYEKLAFLSPHYVLLFSRIASGVAAVGVVWGSVFLSRKPVKYKMLYLNLFLFVFMLAMVAPTREKIGPYRDQVRALEGVLELIRDQALPLPVFFSKLDGRDLLIFLSETNPPAEFENSVLFKEQQIPDDLTSIENGYVVLVEGKFQSAPQSWWEIIPDQPARFGNRYVIFRTLTGQALDDELSLLSAKLENAPNAETLDRLYGAYLNSGQYCLAYEAWISARVLDHGESSYIPILGNEACIRDIIASGKSRTNELSQFLGQYRIQGADLALNQIADEKFPESVWMVRQREVRIPDPRTFTLQAEMQPDSFYIYSVWVRAKEPIFTLFWATEEKEEFYRRSDYPEWARLEILVYSGNLGEYPVVIDLSPAMAENYGAIYLYDLKFVQLPPAMIDN
jgi:hypothetical protein